MNNNKDIYDTVYPKALPDEQLSPFGKNSDIDFIEEDESAYYAMADDIKDSEK